MTVVYMLPLESLSQFHSTAVNQSGQSNFFFVGRFWPVARLYVITVSIFSSKEATQLIGSFVISDKKIMWPKAPNTGSFVIVVW